MTFSVVARTNTFRRGKPAARHAATADGRQIQLWTCNGGVAQVWSAQSNGTLRNPNSGKCLDVSNNSSADGQAVHLWTCHTGANQRWVLP
ncbi:RICIN domain-containing protein [Micromonospora sediminimaris]|uniref:RICIN domain-containing protein n=1 Tax=Micromonospora sediminimaris TaxID=547162 RepID=UPI0037B3DED1